MKNLLLIMLITAITVSAQFNGGVYNNFMNVGDMSTLELIPGTKMSKEDKMADDLVGNLFGSMGVNTKTNENPIFTMTSYKNSAGQLWEVVKEAENEFVIYNRKHELAMGIEGASKAADAKVIPTAYKKGDPNTVFILERDTVDYRYGSYLVNKNSGKVVEVNPKTKELFQADKKEGNKYQIWALALRKKLVNVAYNAYLSLEKTNSMFNGAPVILTNDAKSITANWDLINLPTTTGWYYIMNSFSKKFISIKKSPENIIADDAQLFQNGYNKENVLVYSFDAVEGKEGIYYFEPNFGKGKVVEGGAESIKVVLPDSTSNKSLWKLTDGSFSLF